MFKKISIVFVLIVMIFSTLSLASCALFDGDDMQLSKERYVVHPYEDKTANSAEVAYLSTGTPIKADDGQDVYKVGEWRYGNYSYYKFYLGKVTNVPISYQKACYFDKTMELTMTYETATFSEDEVEKSVSDCITSTTSETHSGHVNVTTSVSSEAGGLFNKVSLGLEVEVGYEGSSTKEKSVSTSNTVSTAKSFTNETRTTNSYVLNDKKEVGYYRYTLYSITDVFAYVRFDNDDNANDKEFNITYEACAREENYFYAIDFSQDGDFTKSTSDKRLTVPDSVLNSLEVVQGADNEYTVSPLYNSKIGTVSYEGDSASREVSTDGNLGMATQLSNADSIDVSSMSGCFNDDYVFEFNFEMRITANSGEQELYLYNAFLEGDTTTNSCTRKYACDKGLVAEKLHIKSTNANSTHSVTFRVAGSSVKNIMYTKFGARDNAWTLAKLTCEINVYFASNSQFFNSPTSPKQISDDGYFGGNQPAKADTLNLTEFSSVLNANYNITLVVALTMCEHNDGWQEIYLYDNITQKFNSDNWENALNKGCVATLAGNETYDYGYNKKDTVETCVYFSVTVSGDKLNNTMYLRYDAGGNDDDDWKIFSGTVFVYATKK